MTSIEEGTMVMMVAGASDMRLGICVAGQAARHYVLQTEEELKENVLEWFASKSITTTLFFIY